MKQSRRKELRTNELSLYLKQIYEAAVQYSTHVIGAVVIVVLILVMGFYIRHNQHVAMQAAWNEYLQVREMNPVTEPSALDRARNLVDQHGEDPELGPLVRELLGRMLLTKAMMVSPVADQAEQVRLLQEAKGVFTELVARFGQRSEVAARAELSLGSIAESLAVAGEAQPADARRHYDALMKDDSPTYNGLATELVSGLDDRLRKLKVVSTRPAEEPAGAGFEDAPAEPADGAPATSPAVEPPATAPAVPPATSPA